MTFKKKLRAACCALTATVCLFPGVSAAGDSIGPSSNVAAAPRPAAVGTGKSDAAPSAVSGASTWFRMSGTPVVRVGIVKFVRPAPNEAIVDASVEAIERFFGKDNVKVTYLTLSELAVAIREGTVDVFLSSAGFFRSMTPDGVRDLATAVSRAYPDPNLSDGSAFLVAGSRTDIRRLSDLRGKTLVTSTPRAFTGLLVPQGEILSQGYNPENFFASTLFMGDGAGMEGAPELLKNGSADVAFVRLCFLEEYLERHPEEKGHFKVINRKDPADGSERCARSTDLYPTWTMATTKTTDPSVSRLVTRALLQMPPVGRDGLYWGVATDYSRVDQLFKDMKTGHYAYLRNWTVERFFRENWQWVMLVFMMVLGLIGHSVRVTKLVHLRTASLQKSLAEQKVLQARERAAAQRVDKLEKAGVIAQLSVIFAHEMRQPLGAISLYSFALKKMLTSGRIDEKKAEGVLMKLDEQTARANEIVTRVRAYAKAEGPQRAPVRFLPPIEHAVADLRSTGRYSAEIRLIAEADPTVFADPLELELVALNLIKNSLQALAEEGSGGRVLVTLGLDADRAVLVVSDNGTRVTDETVKRLSSSLESTKAEGLGLGLSIVRGILESYAGKLTYAKRDAGGLIARVTVPLWKADDKKDGGQGTQPTLG